VSAVANAPGTVIFKAGIKVDACGASRQRRMNLVFAIRLVVTRRETHLTAATPGLSKAGLKSSRRDASISSIETFKAKPNGDSAAERQRADR
jgi:hypothetical protein